jgi:hypothetical protein
LFACLTVVLLPLILSAIIYTRTHVENNNKQTAGKLAILLLVAVQITLFGGFMKSFNNGEDSGPTTQSVLGEQTKIKLDLNAGKAAELKLYNENQVKSNKIEFDKKQAAKVEEELQAATKKQNDDAKTAEIARKAEEARQAEIARIAEETKNTINSTAQKANCDPNYDPCIRFVPGNSLNCPDIGLRVHVIGVDHNKFDRDGNGWGCESYR